MRNYENLQVWQKAHRLTLEVYRNTRCFPSEDRFGLTSQIRRSSSSIGANLAEGCGRRSDGKWHGLCKRLAHELEFLSKASFDRLRSDLSEVMRMLSSLSEKLRPRAEAVQLRAKG